ncbi:sigma-54 interaction domain-containing protein [Halofilum ochraceum]|uniref:sigma-54 interaction domain-containing protein n=1 Tax=Halofilum ochraceum TaxID=1611323 RepID=UPI001C303EEC|nr:sigma-54 dependent transcriptional regulator [Halofilum ochraceum]
MNMEARGWSPVIHREIGEPLPPMPGSDTAPGVIALDGASPPDSRQIEAILGNSRREWIALVPGRRNPEELLTGSVADCLFAHHPLPPDPDSLDTLLRHAAGLSALRQKTAAKESDEDIPQDTDESEMVGTTPAMMKLFGQIRKTARVDAPVLIHGESGTGKELAAHAIHERSPRAEGPFIAVNCGALPTELIQSELFGHEKGAFTGAIERHEGRIEAASGGTLLLDEIGDLPLNLQANLLRFLQSGVIQRVGSSHDVSVDVRILAATNVDIADAVAAGDFREDLFHRLNVLQLEIPPLRERPDDIEVLARFFFDRFQTESAPSLSGISRNALHVMRHYDWPGNVRELINRMRRGMVMAEGRLLQPEDLGLERRGHWRRARSLEEVRENAEREAIHAALIRNRQCVTEAAQELDVSRMTLYRLMDRYGLRDTSEA